MTQQDVLASLPAHLSQVLEEFAAAMCFKRGGAQSLQTAIDAQSICTAQYDSGMQVSGVMAEVLEYAAQAA